VISQRPHRDRAFSLDIGVEDPQAFHAEQRRCRILGHSARGSLLIMFLGRSMILEAAGVLITVPRRSPAPPSPRLRRLAGPDSQ
jgi:hypothetical protein